MKSDMVQICFCSIRNQSWRRYSALNHFTGWLSAEDLFQTMNSDLSTKSEYDFMT